jgi:RNA polymerase sigma-70 factor (ECF subfamily)
LSTKLITGILEETGYTDSDLVERLATGSHAAFETIFKRYYPGLSRFARAYLMNRALAEDIVQDAFTALWARASSLPPATRLKHYLYSAVKHACFDYLKHLRVVDANHDKLTEALLFSGSVEYEENRELLDKIEQCLRALPEQQRRILDMKLYQGLSYREIARELDISEATVHTHVKRAYQSIRASFPLLYLLLRLWSWKEF